MTVLPQKITDCACGMVHECPVKDIVIGDAATDSLAGITAEFGSILLVADNNTWRVCGQRVAGILGSRVTARHIYTEDGVVIPNETAIEALEASVVRRKHFCGCAKSYSVFSECAFFWFMVPANRRIPSRVADAAMG